MIPEMKAPNAMNLPLIVHPRPGPFEESPARALINGVMMFVVNEEISVLKARATTRPTAITMRSPLMRKFLNPFIISVSLSSDAMTIATAIRDCRPRQSARETLSPHLNSWRITLTWRLCCTPPTSGPLHILDATTAEYRRAGLHRRSKTTTPSMNCRHGGARGVAAVTDLHE